MRRGLVDEADIDAALRRYLASRCSPLVPLQEEQDVIAGSATGSSTWVW